MMDDIVEVAECGKRKANLYLENGYRLLYLGQRRFDKPFPGDWNDKTYQYFVAESVQFVLGRIATVAHYDPPEWAPPAG